MEASSLPARSVAVDSFAVISPATMADARRFPAHARPPADKVRSFGRIASVSPAMGDLFDFLLRLSPSEVTLTFVGETGTGKDVMAHAVHDAGPRAKGPFVVFDCGAVPPNLVESELFGHERGAFTGAHAEHEGAFERATGGTLFLDEIGELPLDLQPRLLRALENRSIRRVGGTHERRINARILAATNRDLATSVAGKHFRQDLYFRLVAAVVRLPPLRDRLEDLPLLVGELLLGLGRGQMKLAPETVRLLNEHCWPGNVRELKNVLACALALVDSGGVLEPAHLRFASAAAGPPSLERLALGGQTLANVEHVTIQQTLALTRGNKVKAARLLGISASTLHEKLKRLAG